MSEVRVTFLYEPDEPDEADRSGMSEEEFIQLFDQIAALGGYDIEVERT